MGDQNGRNTFGALAVSVTLLGVKIGELLAQTIQQPSNPQKKVKGVARPRAKVHMKYIHGVLNASITVSELLGFSLSGCILAKMAKNEFKYPLTSQAPATSDRIIPKWNELKHDATDAERRMEAASIALCYMCKRCIPLEIPVFLVYICIFPLLFSLDHSSLLHPPP